VGKDESMLKAVGNMVEINTNGVQNIDGMNGDTLEESDSFFIKRKEFRNDRSKLHWHPSISEAFNKKEKILYFVASNGNNHSTLFILLENGQLFSFGLTAQMNNDSFFKSSIGQGNLLNQATSTGTIFLSSPDGVYNRSGKGLAYIKGTLGDTYKKLYGIRRDSVDFQIADIGQLRYGHLQRIMYMVNNQSQLLIVDTEDTEKRGNIIRKKLFSMSSMLDEDKAKYSLLALEKDGYNCAYMLEWIFQERVTCAKYFTRQPVACRRRNKTKYLEKEEIQEIIDVYTSQFSTRDDLIKITEVPGEGHKYDIDNLPKEGIIKNPPNGTTIEGIARNFVGLKF
jgi:hypothetical protein